ncbi:dynamin family protein [Seiridium cupressi]
MAPRNGDSSSRDGGGFLGSVARFWTHSYAPDYVGFAGLLTAYILIQFLVEPFHRMFFINDLRIAFPHAEHERVPVSMNFVYALFIPLGLILFINGITRASFHKHHSTVLGLAIAVILTSFLTDIVKNTVGRPRPDLISRCKPAEGTPRDVLVTIDVCTETEHHTLHDGWRSFPSGHSSFSFAGLGYTALFLAGQLRIFRDKKDLGRALISLAPLVGAAMIAISRCQDYRHDVYDVCTGSLLGMVVGFWSYRTEMEERDERGWHRVRDEEDGPILGRNETKSVRMPARTRIKAEPREESEVSSSSHSKSRSPSVGINSRMAPPTIQSVHGNQSFIRSHAPSVDTRAVHPHNQFRGDDIESETTHDTPQLMELRSRHQAPQSGSRRRSTPSSQTGDNLMQQSFTHQSFTDIASKLKDCNDTLAELQQLGIQHVAQLPELVMVGDQSAGKSSLMSGLAELDLPRSGGVCTRCPIHIRLSRHDRWSCTVSLQQDYDFRPSPSGRINKRDVTRANPFPPWVPQHRVVKNFKSLDFEDRHQIEDVLRWAQIAILNYDSPTQLYVPGEGAYAREHSLQSAAANTRAQFSPNIVSLEMKGPSYPDLSFYDLPGVFSTPAQEEDDYLVDVVKNLARHYIRKDSAIILWALPMNNDPETSISLSLIREARAQVRTIGVMTKADMLRMEDTASWIAILRGEKHRVGHGYFITSRPTLDNNESLERAAQWEESFFTGNDERWPREFKPFESRCGVEGLKDFLSKRLGEAFSRSLPQIEQKVKEAKRDIEAQLRELPELPRNVEYEVKQSLKQFKEAVKEAIVYTDFQSQWDKLNKQFQACILAIKPTCTVRTQERPTYRVDPSGALEILSDSESVAADTPSRKRPRASDSTIRGTPKRPRPEPSVTTPVTIKHEDMFARPTPNSVRGSPMPDPLSPFQEFHQLGRRGLDIQNIQGVLASRRRAGMPADIVPSDVYDVLINRAINKWEQPLKLYTELTMKLFKSMLNSALNKSMAVLSKRLIFNESRMYLEEYIMRMDGLQTAAIFDLFQAETYEMYTTNEDAFKRYREEELEILRRARAIERLRTIGVFSTEYRTRPTEQMAPEHIVEEREKIVKNLPKLGTDEFANEIGVAAIVRGYYILAAMRLVESVTLSVKSKLFRDVASDNLHTFLEKKLGLDRANDDTFNRLMEEDNETANKREQFKKEKEKLELAIQKISNLELGDGGALDGFVGPTGSVLGFDESMDDV